jgi:hypothetical protein
MQVAAADAGTADGHEDLAGFGFGPGAVLKDQLVRLKEDGRAHAQI